MKIKNLNKRLLIIFPALVSLTILAQSSSPQITINMTHGLANKYVALYVTDESTKASIYNESYKATAQVNGTDAGGNFIRVISGLNPAHTYSVTILMDVDNLGSVNNTDLGKTFTGITTGSTITINSLNPLSALENISLTASADARFSGKKAACMASELSFVYPDVVVSGFVYGSSGASVLFYDTAGNPSWNNLWLPAGKHGNVICVLDNNANKIMDTSDYYAIGVKNGSHTNFSLGEWFVVP